MFEKKKMSIDFNLPEYKLLTDEAKRRNESSGYVVNQLIGLILSLPAGMRQEIGTFCGNKYAECAGRYRQVCSDFEKQERHLEMQRWNDLRSFFCAGLPECDSKQMQKIRIKDGYCVCPSDWVVLGEVEGKPSDCMYAGVVESRNWSRYNIPHFLFFCNVKYACDYTEDLYKKVYAEVAKAYPDFDKYLNMQVELSKDDINNEKLVREWEKAPCFGLFHLVEKGDPLYWNSVTPTYVPPAGAMVVRDRAEDDDGLCGNHKILN